jgi:hypothetical protein
MNILIEQHPYLFFLLAFFTVASTNSMLSEFFKAKKQHDD